MDEITEVNSLRRQTEWFKILIKYQKKTIKVFRILEKVEVWFLLSRTCSLPWQRRHQVWPWWRRQLGRGGWCWNNLLITGKIIIGLKVLMTVQPQDTYLTAMFTAVKSIVLTLRSWRLLGIEHRFLAFLFFDNYQDYEEKYQKRSYLYHEEDSLEPKSRDDHLRNTFKISKNQI